MLHSKKGVDGG